MGGVGELIADLWPLLPAPDRPRRAAARTRRMRKYAKARRIDPCPRRHCWIQPGARGKFYENGPYVYEPDGPRRCLRCEASAPQVQQLFDTLTVDDMVPPGEIWFVGPAEIKGHPGLVRDQVLGILRGVGQGSDG